MNPKVNLLCGNNLDVLKTLPDNSVHTVVTSPPYYGLRQYLEDDAEGKEFEIGLEESPLDYVSNLVAVFSEVKRVLRDEGSLWLNLGDSYWANRSENGQSYDDDEVQRKRAGGKSNLFKPKDLMGMPWRVAFAMQEDGWYLRSDIIWSKSNCMPESVKDRPTRSHEYIFLLTKKPIYFYDIDAIREPLADSTLPRMMRGVSDNHKWLDGADGQSAHTMSQPRPNINKLVAGRTDVKMLDTGYGGDGKGLHALHSGYYDNDGTPRFNSMGRNKRTVWQVNTVPFKEAHFAVFPEKLIEPCVMAGSSVAGVCPSCGAPYERVIEKIQLSNVSENEWDCVTKTTGWKAICECEAGAPIPATVLDPFCGSGTAGVVAVKNGRSFIGIDLNKEYIKMAHRRINKASSQPMLDGFLLA